MSPLPVKPGQTRLLTIEDVADRLGVTVRHVRRLVAEHRIPYVQWGRLVCSDPAAVERWLADHVVPPRRR